MLAVFVQVAAYPGLAGDIAAGIGLSEAAVAGHLAALSAEVDCDAGAYCLSARGTALFAANFVVAPAPKRRRAAPKVPSVGVIPGTPDLQAAAQQILKAVSAPAAKTDLGVLAVLVHVATYPGPVDDIAATTGLSEPAVDRYLAALSAELLLEAEYGVYRLSANGIALLAASLVAAPKSSGTAPAPVTPGLTPDEAVAWEKVKFIIMDKQLVSGSDKETLREAMTKWLTAYDSGHPDVSSVSSIARNMSHNYGIPMHRPGTPTLIEVIQLLHWRSPALTCHEALIRKATRLGLSIW